MSNVVVGLTPDLVKVGNAGNAADAVVKIGGSTDHGDVAYEFSMGKYEVTVAQYTEFLNAIAATDTYSLYYTGASPSQEITQAGSSGSFTYTANAGHENHPVDRISNWNAMRFANWMHNGQPTGAQDTTTTEDGAYFLNGENGTGGSGIARESDAIWWLPSEDEWHKAAYHKNDGVTANYFNWPASSNAKPVAVAPPGTVNNANFNNAASSHFTDVGAYSNSASPYGTFDQGANAWEVIETISSGSFRINLGDSYGSATATYMQSNRRNYGSPNGRFNQTGFRVAKVVKVGTMVTLQ
jgi:formylglycine-generating enzyme required for sulfatase activity